MGMSPPIAEQGGGSGGGGGGDRFEVTAFVGSQLQDDQGGGGGGGGGGVRISSVGNITVNGSILADGAPGAAGNVFFAGGGAGGSGGQIWIQSFSQVAVATTATIRANGGSPSVQTFLLPQGTSGITGKPFWSGDAIKGFKYKDSKGENSAVKSAQIKKTASGNFSIKVVVSGKLGPVIVTPPNPGTSGCVLLGINGGDTYSVAFKPLDGIITNKGAATPMRLRSWSSLSR